MGRTGKHYSISTQFVLLLLASGIFCAALFVGLHWAVQTALAHYFLDSEIEERTMGQRISNFQEYVTEHGLTVKDTQAISQWTRGKPLILMEIYRDNVLVYSSYAQESLEGNDAAVPYYEWFSYYQVEFADGTAEVLLYCDDAYRYFTLATIGEVLFCSLLFLTCFLIGCQRVVRYIRLLKGEVQAMEAGDLNTPITLSGRNDLTDLAESLDAMRIALRTQQDQTAWTYAANQTLISEMSHDLRTPLTTLLIYTEILRYGKYQDQEQLLSYLNKIDAKAHQIKQLSENILEYSLAARSRQVELDIPSPAKETLLPPLEDAVFHLERCGFACQTDYRLRESLVAVHKPFLRRIIDNLTSNVAKYAKPHQPVKLSAWEEEDQVLVSFENVPDPEAQRTESTCIGLSSVRTMMEKLGGACRVEQNDHLFRVTLSFPRSSQQKPS